MKSNPLVPLKDAATALGIAVGTLRVWIREKRIAAEYKMRGKKRRWYIRQSEIDLHNSTVVVPAHAVVRVPSPAAEERARRKALEYWERQGVVLEER